MNARRTNAGGRIDRSAPLRFTFDGAAFEGLAGDTLASALLANNIHLMGRSFKYHRPRGAVSAGSEEPNALANIARGPGRETPNNRMTMTPLYEGLCATSQNRWPSLGFDMGALNQLAGPILSAGFYYKSFMWPPAFWKAIYEPAIRRMAGLGRTPTAPDPDAYTSRYAHCETLIIGAGPAGLIAALDASKDGASVILVDEQTETGGGLLAAPSELLDEQPAWDWLATTLETLRARPNVQILTQTTAFGFYHQNMLGLVQRLTDHLPPEESEGPRERLWRVRAKQVVLATGAIERPVMFDNNDRPGVMLAAAAREYLNLYGVKIGQRAVVVTNNDSAYAAAFELAAQDVEIAGIVDSRTDVDVGLQSRARALDIEVFTGYRAVSAKGRKRVTALLVRPSQNGVEFVFKCDAILMSGGWTPSAHLFSQAGGALNWSDDAKTFVPSPDAAGPFVTCVGACNGDVENALATTVTIAADTPVPTIASSGKAFVDFQNDVTANDIRLAVREGFHSVEHIKRYTTNGMATDQGKLSNINALAVAADALDCSIPDIGLTTYRPPYTPVTFGALANHRRGEAFDVLRKTPIDPWAVEYGAIFEPVGQWRRARYFPKPGEDMNRAVARECRATRNALGIFDGSTLGKIEVVGPDSAEFLDRLYTNKMASLAPGHCRYGLMLGENGFILDDGVVARLSETRFHVTTTTGCAAHVLSLMEDYRQTEWPDLRVWLTSTTEQWAVIALNGPNARAALAPLVVDIDLSPEAFPHMTIREGAVCGVPARVFRVSFTGELGYEINVPAGHGLAVWKQLVESGKKFGGTPYGTEAMHALRAEKGYIIVGQETDGTVTPMDAGMGWAISKTKSDFVGKRSLTRPDIVAPDRKQLVGLKTKDPGDVLEEGLQITQTPGGRSIGHVTSSYWSETLQSSIALAIIEGGRNRRGETLIAAKPKGYQSVTIVDPVFYDPKGARLHV
ncbi:MAG: sarcosine oxidase subunit alpha [Alphaproteobacteria bacterium]|jgi:sarcosine oxidase subunit alpha